MISASASAAGGSRAVFEAADARQWRLISTPYALAETRRNLASFPEEVTATWQQLVRGLEIVPDIVTIDRPAVFPVGKDRPILFSALAAADVLLTLDRADFGGLLGTNFYGLKILTPGMWLESVR